MLYIGVGIWGSLATVLAAGLVVYLLIRFAGTPEPEGGWWLVQVQIKSPARVRDESSLSLEVDLPGAEPLVTVGLSRKTAFLFERQLYRISEDSNSDYQARVEAGALDQETWLDRQGLDPSQAKKKHPGYVHYLGLEISRKGRVHWQAIASLERSGWDVAPQLDGLLAAVFDCLGRGEEQGTVEVPVREHDYLALLKERFGD